MKLSSALALFLLLAGALAYTPALAQQIETYSRCCGPVTLNVEMNGRVTGFYPKQGGVLDGSIGQDGIVTGIWTQPRSDYPCVTSRNGSDAWGHFFIRNIGAPNMSGSWGYCDTIPTRAFGFE